MKETFNVFRILNIDYSSPIPIYLQISYSITRGIREEKIQVNDSMPSLNNLAYELEISRDTASKAYNHLKKAGVLKSFPGKGYYISSGSIEQPYRIFLLFNKLSDHKKIIFDAFIKCLGSDATIDFHIYSNDYFTYKKLITKSIGLYTHYVIIPYFANAEEHNNEILNLIPPEKLILLDKRIENVSPGCSIVYEDFEGDIYTALDKLKPRLFKYKSINLIFPPNIYYPNEIRSGFVKFCTVYGVAFRIVPDISAENIRVDEVYINLVDDDLVILLEKILLLKLEIGKNIGVISYNESPIKKVLLDGITTISTDFYMMGNQTAQLILNNICGRIAVPFYATLRNSI